MTLHRLSAKRDGGTVSSGTREPWKPQALPADREAARALLEWAEARDAKLYAMGLDLRGADLSGGNFSESWFSEAVLTEVAMADAEFYRADFEGAYLSGADFARASLVRANLDETDLQRARLDGADLVKASFYSVDARRASFRGTRIMGASLLDVNLCGADLAGAHLQENLFEVQVDDETQFAGLTGSVFGPVELLRSGERYELGGAELADWIAVRGGSVEVLSPRRPL